MFDKDGQSEVDRMQSYEKLIAGLLLKLEEKKTETFVLLSVLGISEIFEKISNMGKYLDQIIDDLPNEFQSKAEILAKIMQLEKDQYSLMKELTSVLIEKYQNMVGINDNNLSCVYWGGGNDEFTHGMPGYWKSVGSEGSDGLFNLKLEDGKLLNIMFDVAQEGLPSSIGVGSTKIALFKTLGSAPPELFDSFWQKIVETHSLGGLLITSDDIPDEYKEIYEEFIISGSDNNTIEISNITHSSIDGGYVPAKLKFWKKKKLITRQ